MTPNPNPSPELLPCPFCGHDDPVVYPTGDASKTVQGGCRNPDCILFDCFPGNFTSSDHFAEWWNTRALSPQTLPAPGEGYKLPCDVHLPTATVICAGCDLSTLKMAMEYEGRPRHFEGNPRASVPTDALAAVAAANDEGVALQAARDEVIHRARSMPRKTPAAGGCATVHQFPLEAGEVWMLDKALTELDRLLSQGEGK